MNLRRKTLLVIALTQMVMIVIILLASQTILVSSYMGLENNEAEVNAKRGVSVISNMVSDLSNKAYDWAEWDDTYNFIQDLNPEYLRVNLVDSTFTSLRVNLIVFVNSTGSVVYGKAFSFEDEAEIPVSPELMNLISNSGTLWNFSSPDNETSGVVNLSNAPLLVASRPILTSVGDGPIRGAVIMGLFLDAQTIEQISESVVLPVSITPYAESNMPSGTSYSNLSSQLGDAQIYVKQPENDSISGCATIKDVNGVNAFTLTVTSPMTTLAQGQNSIYFFLAAYAVSGLAIGVISVVLIERTLLSRVDHLAAAVKNMGKSKNLRERLPQTGESKDEISLLADAIDSMVEERFNTIGDLAGMVGHDLRNPLTGIAGAIYYLRKKSGSQLDPKAQEMFTVIEQNVEFSNKIINDLLEYSRKIKLDLSITSPKDLVKESLTHIQFPGNITLLNKVEDSSPIEVDQNKIQRVFINIIKNAVDAMPEGGAITLTSKVVNGKVSFAFKDTGVGISDADKEKLFEPLFTTKAKGMGFGLAICKRMVEAHGGTITVESAAGSGSTFIVTFPVHQPYETKRD